LVNIPNLITTLRGLSVPVFIMAIHYSKPDLALLIFLLASISDAVDGFLARRLNQVTRVGVIIDPIADKALIDSGFLMLSFNKHVIPVWLSILVISRDAFIVVGAWLLTAFGKIEKVKPDLVGKLTAFLQFATILLSLVYMDAGFGEKLLRGTFILTGTFTALSGVDYAFKGIKELNG